jgi:hypothetical protein
MAEISIVGPQDYADLAMFLSSFPGLAAARGFWDSRFSLWWEANPAFGPAVERGWLLRDQGRVVGFLGNVPSLFQLDGEPVTAYNASTWMVLPEYRGRSLELLLRQLAAARQTVLFNGTPTEAVARLIPGLGFKTFPWGDNRKSFLALNPRRCLEDKLGAGLGGRLLSGLLAPVLHLLQRVRLRHLKESGQLQVRRVERADPEFDLLWEKTRRQFQQTNVRTSAVLRWQAFMDPFLDNRLLGCYEGGALLGYTLLKVRKRGDLAVLDCVDLWLDQSRPEVAGALVAYACRYAALEKFDLISFPHFSRDWGLRLRRWGFLEAAASHKGFFKAAVDINARIEAGPSYFTALQGDESTAP